MAEVARGRKTDPNTMYRIHIRRDKGYMYASTFTLRKSKKSDGEYMYYTNWGKIENNVFVPNERYINLSREERVKYIFPPEIDMHLADKMNGVEKNIGQNTNKSDPQPEANEPRDEESIASDEQSVVISKLGTISDELKELLGDQYANKLYGDVWLLEQLADNYHVTEDLISVFDNDMVTVNQILSAAIYPYVTGGKPYTGMAKWQDTHKLPLEFKFKSASVTNLSQRITRPQLMNFCRARIGRLPKGSAASCDSTSVSAWGYCLADIHWGVNKDNPKLKNTVEVVVYSLDSHEPFYIRSFPGNTMDMNTIRTVIRELYALGFSNVIFIIDRGYSSDENIARMIDADIPFLACAKIGTSRITSLLSEIKYSNDGLPIDMKYLPGKKLYAAQVVVPGFDVEIVDDGSETNTVTISGLKVNFYLDLSKRLESIEALKEKQKLEKTELEAMLNNTEKPSDIKAVNKMYSYYKLVRDNNDNLLIVEKDAYEKEKARCGFFCSVMHGLDITPEDALCQYSERDEHEKMWDLMKDVLGFYSQQVWSENSKEGRSFIILVGLILASKVRCGWKNTGLKENYNSSGSVLDEMTSIRYVKVPGLDPWLSTFTGEQYTICRELDVKVPLACLPKSLRAKEKLKRKDLNSDR